MSHDPWWTSEREKLLERGFWDDRKEIWEVGEQLEGGEREQVLVEEGGSCRR